MATLVVLIVVFATILAVLCLANAVSVLMRESHARRDADAATARLHDRYLRALSQMRRHR